MVSATGTKTRVEDAGELGIPGLEHYALRDYKRLLGRKKWTIVAIALMVALLTSTVAYLIPNKYRASTIVVVDPSKVAAFVKSTATLSAAERLALLQQQILSDTRLAQVIDEMGLYTDLKKTETMDVILERMRKDILVEPVVYSNKNLQAFKLSFVALNPGTAAKVANRLTSLFIDENLRAREEEVGGTTEFFNHELEKARESLAEKARKLEQLKTRYASDLPEAQNVHLQALSTAQLEMREQMDAVTRAQQEKAYLQATLGESPKVVDLDSASSDAGTADMQEQLGRLEGTLSNLRARYGPDYPDVVKRQAEIAALKRQISEQEKSGGSAAKPGPMKHSNPVIESQIAALDQEIQSHLDREKELKSKIDYHESKLEGAPTVAGQIAAATREYENAEEDYKQVQDHKFSADVSADVEARQKGERFVVLEPAQPPTHPYQPKRLLIDLLALVAGIPLGIFAVIALEMLDSTIKTARELNERLRVPVFGEIPWLETSVNRRRHRLWTLIAAGGNMLVACGYLALLALAIRLG